ncbi:hypothetical protein K504DRAFT_66081 [Pleomassaria siparia CBS 279.74]|uniref:Uncharacterized protein n=1 Tax=Pleomassaria siparia CBS 279.74 TaxID=1314801 RepID=A0A6G1K1Z6_9PLEO|nr:hypothetical protein K504DRAFT_66081 [Pleomassaria siparia CBS 279.74]
MPAFRSLAACRNPATSFHITQRAGIHSSIARFAGKESALGQEGREHEIQQEKEDSLKKQKEGKGQWKDGLASDSESIVKADRGEIEASHETIKKLQEETKKVAGK